jgi:carbon monoxide dehydrogenase subunit G
VRASVEIPAPASRVWAELRDLASHTAWMDDAMSITFTSAQREGVGTTFDCVTRIGLIRLHDRMRVTGWDDGRMIAIRHEGFMRGRGRFTVKRKGRRQTRVTWTEHLRAPWWLGGRVSGVAAGIILRRVARRDLANLRNRVAQKS